MTVKELKQELRERGLPNWKNKDSLIKILETAIAEEQALSTPEISPVPGDIGSNDDSDDTVVGNYQPPQYQSDKWVMTWNNYPGDIRVRLEKLIPLCEKYIFGFEVGESGTPHVQGAFTCHEKISFDDICVAVGSRAHHCVRMRGKWSDQKYCAKEGDFITNFFDYLITVKDLRPAQLSLRETLIQPVCKKFSRAIDWFWEDRGDWGKTILQTHLVDFHKALIVGGSEKDMLCAVALAVAKGMEFNMILINMTYDKKKVSYNGMESLKDGMFFNGKYESGMVRFPRCRIAVFANCEPETDRMGKNRFNVVRLSEYDVSDDVVVKFD